MSKLALEIETAIRAHHLPSLQGVLPPDEFILPHYEGLSLANLPATDAALLGVSLPGAPPPCRVISGGRMPAARAARGPKVDARGATRRRAPG